MARLSDPKREVVVLRLLCGHSLDHTAHLSGFTRRAVRELTAGATAPPPPPPAAEEFEHHLAQGDPDPPSTHAILAGPLAVARSLRQAAHSRLAGPDPALVERLRQSLLTGTPLTPRAVPDPAHDPRPLAPQTSVSGAGGSLTPRSRGPRIGRVAERREW